MTAQGLPAGAVIEKGTQYGQAFVVWTPTASQVGPHDISLVTSDSGLPPVRQGIPLPLDFVAKPNTVTNDLRIVVRDSNVQPQVLTVKATGGDVIASVAGSNTVSAAEGVPLAIEVLTRDLDFDALNWQVSGLPEGMQMVNSVGADGQTRLTLQWTPGMQAAQILQVSGGQDPAGVYRIQLQASDGSASTSHELILRVANTNQAPQFIAQPLKLVHEGETLGFSLNTVDADGDTLQVALVRSQDMPSGVYFEPNTGYFEWTPDQDAINNLRESQGAYTFRFTVSDGQLTSVQEVQVRVLDSNRPPQIAVSNHALVVGRDFRLPVLKANTLAQLTQLVQLAQHAATGLHLFDADGTLQTAALNVVFESLPEGAQYDPQSGVLHWVPGPGQVGDFVVTALVSDGYQSVKQSFTLRVVANEAANAPSILVDLTPATPSLPGQSILASVRADSYAAISQITVQVRGSAIGLSPTEWQTVTLESAGRLRLTAKNPGLAEIQVSATDVDGFSSSYVQKIMVRDPQDRSAPLLSWGSGLPSDNANFSADLAPLVLIRPSMLQARISDTQLMGWKLEIAPGGSGNGATVWRTLDQASVSAQTVGGLLDLSTLDTTKFANGLYQLRLSAWDLSGRSSEVYSRVLVDSSDKALTQGNVTDTVFQLGKHSLAITRHLSSSPTHGELGNWSLPLLDSRLSSDQSAFNAQGGDNAWREGARVWLQMPASVSLPNSEPQHLRFTLGTSTQAQASNIANNGTPATVTHPTFTSDNPLWQLEAVNDIAAATQGNKQAPSVTRLGGRLFDLISGQAWKPAAYVLTGPDGTRYTLDAAGKVQALRFSDGEQWQVSDAGIVALTRGADNAASTGARVDFVRNANGAIASMSGPLASAVDGT